MEIQVKLLGILRDKTPTGGRLELNPGATVDDAVRAIGACKAEIQAVAVNSRIEHKRDYRLSPGDELTVLPPVIGGCGRLF